MDAIIGETGIVEGLNHNSQTIFLEQNYNNPVIFAQPLSYQGSDAAIVRIEDIQSDRFTAFLQEPRNLDGIRTKESFSYLVVEEGTWQLDDDTLLEVGTVNTNLLTSDGWEDIDFSNNFTADPLVFSQVQTDNGSDFVRTRQRNTSLDGFQVAMEEEEAFNNSGHAQETVGWMAISEGSGNWSQNNYLAGATGNTIDHKWHTIDFSDQFSQPPAFLASIATYNGGDSSGLRSNNLDKAQIDIKIEEDTTRDQETYHANEKINYLAIDANITFSGTKVGQEGNQNNQGNLLFKSGFEGDIKIVPSGNNKHTISGTDSETNFSWDTDLPAEKAQFLYLTGKESPEPYIENRIEQVLGADGNLTNALYMEVTKDYKGDNSVTRNEFQLFPWSDMRQGYIKYSMKLQPNYWDAFPDKDAWRVFMEWKEPDLGDTGGTNNYRFNTSIKADRDQIHWSAATQQVQPNRRTEWTADNKEVSVPIDEWFDVEVFWRKGGENNGRLWFAVNGEEVLDFQGRTQHADRPQDLQFWSIFKVYTGLNSLKNGPVYQWIDDVEIRSDVPRSF
ncbi:MAG: hypothetical protein AAF383_00960 [Cyanobacteria bacterium P01_A01_bin.83]